METYGINQDSLWMTRALELAHKGLGTTSPNPPVGAVVVKDGVLLGEGWHERAGELHAERRALNHARLRGHSDSLRGATMYVTLEPCSSYGRTPPCTEAIIEAGIARVVYGSVDPDERHSGRADGILRAAGIEVCSECCATACDLFLRPWAWSVQHRMPWVKAKVASTMDGRMTRAGLKWLSCGESVRFAHQMRLESDAILVGGNTLRTDNPALTIRHPYREIPIIKQQPWRVVMTRDSSTLPEEAKVFTDKDRERTIILEDVGNLSAMLHTLYESRGVVNLMLECGGNLLRTFLEEGLVNEWVQIVTPQISGGPDLVVPGYYLPEERFFEQEELIPSGKDIIVRGIIR
ncbi:MAG: bifunctional diaminohydroxyphosphoribosylaminopyrimidine deaminase/5-amino-6-(5-phosphoribosylamino)uracil reductase RibD [Akkermansia sp.]|nr:bifunctional diaminohydroxyphosphoribosylaminopyrimidine deaminase/5-amino-6-(5-phosphoribosylamino)uracil reductase RibD [Akkermansia sp.]